MQQLEDHRERRRERSREDVRQEPKEARADGTRLERLQHLARSVELGAQNGDEIAVDCGGSCEDCDPLTCVSDIVTKSTLGPSVAESFAGDFREILKNIHQKWQKFRVVQFCQVKLIQKLVIRSNLNKRKLTHQVKSRSDHQ